MLTLPIPLPDPCRNVAPAIAPPTVRQDCDQLQANESRLPLRVNARPPITPHPPTPLGFAWLWFHRAKKKGKRKEALRKKRSSESAQAGFEGLCVCRQNILIQRDPHRRVSSHDELGRKSSLAIDQLQNGCSDLVHQGC